MAPIFIVKCVIVGLLGTGLSLLAVNYSLAKKAKAANLIYNFRSFFITDWFAPVISIVAIAMGVVFVPYIPAGWQDSPGAILVVFATIGYSGNDIVSRFFSVVNQRLNAAIDVKTTQADVANGTMATPTPAAPIKPNP